jgi:hypothetical protein
MDKAQELLYAVVGAGDFAMEKARNARKLADRKTTEKYYKDFVKRGRALSTRVSSSGPAKQAVTRSKAARTQVKAATTGVTNALRGETKTSRSGTSRASTSKSGSSKAATAS